MSGIPPLPPKNGGNHIPPIVEKVAKVVAKQLFDIRLGSSEAKASQVASQALTKKAETYDENYWLNYGAILMLDTEGFNYIKVEGGQLCVNPPPSSAEEMEDALKVMRQTYRQAGEAIAREVDGSPVQAQRRAEFQQLEQHLFKYFPTVIPGQLLVREAYQKNYQTILTLPDLSRVKVDNGLLMKTETEVSEKERGEVIRLIQQTYRQAWGALIDADKGMAVVQEKLFALNRLSTYLRQHLPDCLPKDPDKPLKILTGAYMPLPVEGEDLPTSDARLTEELAERQEEAKEQLHARIRALENTHLTVGRPDIRGKNYTVELLFDEQSVAIEKSEVEEYMGGLTALMKEGYHRNWKKYAKVGAMNELLAANCSHLFGGMFTVPLAYRDETETLHAFAESKGSFRSLYAKDPLKKWDLIDTFPQKETQGFLFGQVALGGMDCHSNNILIDQNNHPIAIDMGRILGYEPLFLECNLGACYLDWDKALDEPIDEDHKVFWETLDVGKTIETLEQGLQEQMYHTLEDPDLKDVAERNLLHLKARLTTIKLAIEEGFTTQRQILALFLPPISKQESQTYQLKGALVKIINNHGFKKAWQVGMKKQDWDAAEKVLRAECKEILKTPLKELYTDRERYWYAKFGFDKTDYSYDIPNPESS